MCFRSVGERFLDSVLLPDVMVWLVKKWRRCSTREAEKICMATARMRMCDAANAAASFNFNDLKRLF